MSVTYAEVRQWAVWLRIFTAKDLAQAMAVDEAVAERGIRALLWHGICEEAGELPSHNGNGPEVLISYKPLPPGPREHFTYPPEWKTTPGVGELAPPRGMPVRLVDNTERRNMMQGTGGTRLRVRRRDRAYERMREAVAKRREKQKERKRLEHEDPKRKHRDESLPR